MNENIKITHCVFIVPETVILRRSFNFKEKQRKKQCKPIIIPKKFIDILKKFSIRWYKSYIECTIAQNTEKGIWSIAILNPIDNYCKKTGYELALKRTDNLNDRLTTII